MNTVSILACNEYALQKVKKSLAITVENLGGFAPYIEKGETVLLKINLLMKKTPEEATTTHPIFVQALTELLQEYGAKVIIGDSPGGPFQEALLRGVYKAAGMEQVAVETGALLNYDTGAIEMENPNGLYLKRLTVIRLLQKVDKVVSVSKLKTHGMAKMTGAVKNMFGTIPGTLKAEFHLNMPDIKNFANALIDICMNANPVLSFMDAIVGMEGNGPSSGTPRKIGAVLGSNSPYELDFVAAKIIGLSPEEVPTIRESIYRGLCAKYPYEINIVGDPLQDFVQKDFKIPAIREINPLKNRIPKFAEGFVNMQLQPRPVFHHEKCIGCRDCYKNCPPKTIEMVNNRPVVHLDHCIRCFCCQELCPEAAVTIHRPWIFRMLSKL